MNSPPPQNGTAISLKIPFLHIEIRGTTIRGFLVACAIVLLLLLGFTLIAVSLSRPGANQEGRQEYAKALTSTTFATADLKKLSRIPHSLSESSQASTSQPTPAELLESLHLPEEYFDDLRSLQGDASGQTEEPVFVGRMLSLQALGLVARTHNSAFSLTPAGRGILESPPTFDDRCREFLPPGVSQPVDWSGVVYALQPEKQVLSANNRVNRDFKTSACHLYSLSITENSQHGIQTFSQPGTTSADTLIYLVHADNDNYDLIGVDDDGGDGFLSRLRERLRTDSDYYLIVASFDFVQLGSYGLEIAPTDFDRIDTVQEPTSPLGLVVGSDPVLVDIGTGAGEIWYALTVSSSKQYFIETFSAGAPAVDTVVHLYQRIDGSLVLIGEDDDGRDDGSLYSILVEDLLAEQQYFVRVSSFWGESGQFRIGVRGE